MLENPSLFIFYYDQAVRVATRKSNLLSAQDQSTKICLFFLSSVVLVLVLLSSHSWAPRLLKTLRNQATGELTWNIRYRYRKFNLENKF